MRWYIVVIFTGRYTSRILLLQLDEFITSTTSIPNKRDLEFNPLLQV